MRMRLFRMVVLAAAPLAWVFGAADATAVSSAYKGLWLDVCHDDISNESTDNRIRLMVYKMSETSSGSEHVYEAKYQRNNGLFVNCDTVDDNDYVMIMSVASALESDDYAIVINIDGGDAFFIDAAIWGVPKEFDDSYGQDSSVFDKWAWFGRNGGDGYCLSTEESDAEGSWKNYVDQNVKCQPCLEFRTDVGDDGTVYSGTSRCRKFDTYWDEN